MNGKVYVYFNKRKFEQEGVKKYYVGQTSRTIKARAGKDGIRYIKNSETSKFSNAIKKWGWKSFELIFVQENIENQDELNELEKYYIRVYDSFENGYNSTLGGDGVSGCKHTGMYGKEFTEEHRRKLSESHKGLNIGESHPMYGKHHTEEAKTKIKEARKRQKNIGYKYKNMTEEEKYIERVFKEGKPITCDELGVTFLTITEATRYMKEKYSLNCPTSNLIKVCKGERNKCGTIEINSNKIDLHWYYAKTPTTTERENTEK